MIGQQQVTCHRQYKLEEAYCPLALHAVIILLDQKQLDCLDYDFQSYHQHYVAYDVYLGGFHIKLNKQKCQIEGLKCDEGWQVLSEHLELYLFEFEAGSLGVGIQ